MTFFHDIPIIFWFVFSNISVYYTFIFIICSFFLVIILIIWAFLYYLFQGILIIFWFIFSNISVYYILIHHKFFPYSLFIYTNLIYFIQTFYGYIIQVIIHKIFHHKWRCVIMESIYYLTCLHHIWVCDIGECFFPLYNTG